MIYREEKSIFGTWVSVTYPAEPDQKPGGSKLEHRATCEVPEYLQHLTLDQMSELFGPDGKFQNC